MMRVAIGLITSLLILSCSNTQPPTQPKAAEQTRCSADSDCQGDWKCLGGVCTNTSSAAFYQDPAHAVTADKVQREIEQNAALLEKRRQQAMDVE